MQNSREFDLTSEANTYHFSPFCCAHLYTYYLILLNHLLVLNCFSFIEIWALHCPIKILQLLSWINMNTLWKIKGFGKLGIEHSGLLKGCISLSQMSTNAWNSIDDNLTVKIWMKPGSVHLEKIPEACCNAEE